MPEPKCSHAEYQRHVLRSLLHYHERMMMGYSNYPKAFLDGYADALREAIRCIEIVHKDELTSD